jgi:hypothetical protein
MKKLIAIIAFLAILAPIPFMPAPDLFAAAVSFTAGTRQEGACGSWRCITGTVTANSGDTLAVGLGRIIWVGLTRDDNKTNDVIGASVSGGTITFYTDTDGVLFRIVVFGF